MVFLGWLQLIVIILAAGAVAGSLVSALAASRWFATLKTVVPQVRVWLLAALAVLPIAAGVSALAVAFTPSFLHALDLVRDHCAHHSGHAFHLCFVHGHPPDASGMVLGGSGIAFLWLIGRWTQEIWRVRRAGDWGNQLAALARFDADIHAWTLPCDRVLAATVGLFNPQIYVSKKMRTDLSSGQFRAVMAHERAHVNRRDGLVKLLARLAAHLHLPVVRERLIAELDLACEQACDDEAARVIGDRLTVAEAILAVERHVADQPSAALGFGAHAIEQRVRGLLDGDWSRPRWQPILAAAGIIVAALVALYDVLHHAAETFLFVLI
jgi:Zn-dependent protease with chaperone function